MARSGLELALRAKRRLKLRTRVRAVLHVNPAPRPASPDQEAVERASWPDLLRRTVLFDPVWYAEQAGCEPAREPAIVHYLDTGHDLGLSPHPLVDPAHLLGELGPPRGGVASDAVVLVRFLSGRSAKRRSPHPLFDAEAYALAHPEALKHRDGAVGHYVAEGAAAGFLPNDWYVPDTANEPGGLVDWVASRGAEHRLRARDAPGTLDAMPPGGEQVRRSVEGRVPRREDAQAPLVSVVLVVEGDDPALVEDSLRALHAQTLADWELLLVGDSAREGVIPPGSGWAADPRVRPLTVLPDPPAPSPSTVPGSRGARLRNAGLVSARGTYVAWLGAGDVWVPDHLRLLVAVMQADGAVAAHDAVELAVVDGPPVYEAVPLTRQRLAAGVHVDLAALVVARSLALELGGLDDSLPAATEHDLVLRLAARTPPRFVPVVGVRTDATRRAARTPAPPAADLRLLEHSTVRTYHDVVVNRHVIDWEGIAARPPAPDDVTVVVPTYHDWRMTLAAVRAVAADAERSRLRVRTIVVDNGCAAAASSVLASLPLRFPGVQVLANAVNHGFALGNNVALPLAVGDVVVFLNNDTEVRPGWLEPLVDALADPAVLAAQSLLVYPDGTIQSAGVAFPSVGGIPHAFLQGFPVEDAARVRESRFSALTGAAIAVRLADLAELRGFDPVFRNGMEDVDLGLRLRRLREGYLVLRPESVVLHHESKSAGRFLEVPTNRRLLLERWAGAFPGDDERLWAAAGFEVVGHDPCHPLDDRRLTVPEPVLVRRPRVQVTESLPSLRWALKNPAPADPSAETWGDTHFARRLAQALRGLGQEVVIDHRPAFARASGRHDDVVLVLRGLAPYRPVYGQVSIAWLISHPDRFHRAEAESYDRVLAASISWTAAASRRWGLRIDPLLQATDPVLFHPGRGLPDTGHPVLFVGSSRKRMRPIVRDAVEAGLPVSVYGHQWEGLIPDRYVKAGHLPNGEVAPAYRRAGVVLNDHWEDMRVNGFLSNRLFDAVACAARVVTDDVTGLGDLFGRSVQVARSPEDLVRLTGTCDLDSIFGDDEERQGVARRVAREHSFDVRARQLVETACAVRASLPAQRRDELASAT